MMAARLPATVAGALLLTSAPVLAQASITGGTAPDIPWLRLLFSFVLCIGVAVSGILLLRQWQSGGKVPLLERLVQSQGISAARLRVLETRRMGPSGWLCLVAYDGKEYLLATTQTAIVTVAQGSVTADPAGEPDAQ